MNSYYAASRGGYPEAPGYKSRDTARAAAEGIAPRAKSLRARVYDAIKEWPSTPEEVADRIGEPVMNCRPRTSELAAAGRIRDSGQRRQATGGRMAIVWEVI